MIKKLAAENLVFDRGYEDFDKEQFVHAIQPYFADLQRVHRTNFLFCAIHGDGTKDVTGYFSDTTINATINSCVTKCERTGGKWAVYRLN